MIKADRRQETLLETAQLDLILSATAPIYMTQVIVLHTPQAAAGEDFSTFLFLPGWQRP